MATNRMSDSERLCFQCLQRIECEGRGTGVEALGSLARPTAAARGEAWDGAHMIVAAINWAPTLHGMAQVGGP